MSYTSGYTRELSLKDGLNITLNCSDCIQHHVIHWASEKYLLKQDVPMECPGCKSLRITIERYSFSKCYFRLLIPGLFQDMTCQWEKVKVRHYAPVYTIPGYEHYRVMFEIRPFLVNYARCRKCLHREDRLHELVQCTDPEYVDGLSHIMSGHNLDRNHRQDEPLEQKQEQPLNIFQFDDCTIYAQCACKSGPFYCIDNFIASVSNDFPSPPEIVHLRDQGCLMVNGQMVAHLPTYAMIHPTGCDLLFHIHCLPNEYNMEDHEEVSFMVHGKKIVVWIQYAGAHHPVLVSKHDNEIHFASSNKTIIVKLEGPFDAQMPRLRYTEGKLAINNKPINLVDGTVKVTTKKFKVIRRNE